MAALLACAVATSACAPIAVGAGVLSVASGAAIISDSDCSDDDARLGGCTAPLGVLLILIGLGMAIPGGIALEHELD